MENHTDIETLLTKYFEGNTTPPENEQIEAWLNADEEHLRIAKQLKYALSSCRHTAHHKEDRYGKGIRQGKKQNKS